MSRQLAPVGSTLLDPRSHQGRQQDGSSNGDGAGSGQQPITEAEVVGYREQDRFLPINNIARLMRASLPETSKISKDAKECIQECTSEFISFITSEAAEKAAHEKRKTITGDDVLNALKTLGFDEYGEVLLIYLAKYRELQRAEPARKRNRKSTAGAGVSSTSNGSNEPAPSRQEDGDGDGDRYGNDILDGEHNGYSYTYDESASGLLNDDDNDTPFGLDLDALESPDHN